MADTYIKLSEASKKYRIDRHKLAELARNTSYQKRRKGAVIDTNFGGDKRKYAFHEATLVEFLAVDSTTTAIKRHR